MTTDDWTLEDLDRVKAAVTRAEWLAFLGMRFDCDTDDTDLVYVEDMDAFNDERGTPWAEPSTTYPERQALEHWRMLDRNSDDRPTRKVLARRVATCGGF